MLRFRQLRQQHELDAIFENYRYQFLYILRLKLFPKDFSPVNWRHAPILCSEVNRKLTDPETSIDLYSEVGEVIRTAAKMLGEHELRREAASRKAFTEVIEEVLLPKQSLSMNI